MTVPDSTADEKSPQVIPADRELPLQVSGGREKLDHALAEIVNGLTKARIHENGRYSLRYPVPGPILELHDAQAILVSLFPFRADVRQSDRISLVTNAIFATIQFESLTPLLLRNSLVVHHESFLRMRLTRYSLLTHASLSLWRHRLPKRRLHTGSIRFLNSRPSGFTFGELERSIKNLKLDKPPSQWLTVVADVSGRTPTEAAESALFEINVLRGIWNFARNVSLIRHSSSPVAEPVNDICIGPLHTIHLDDGRIASRYFWYQQPHISGTTSILPFLPADRDWLDRIRFERWIRQQLRTIRKLSNAYERKLRRLLAEYSLALDVAEYEESFRRCWALLEQFTACSSDDDRANHKLAVNRAAAVWVNQSHARIILEHLKAVRNDIVHELTSRGDYETCLSQCLRFLHKLMLVHFDNAGKFSSMAEAGEYLSLIALGKTEVARRIKLYQHAATAVDVDAADPK